MIAGFLRLPPLARGAQRPSDIDRGFPRLHGAHGYIPMP